MPNEQMKIYVELSHDAVTVSKNSHTVKANNYDRLKYHIDLELVNTFIQGLEKPQKMNRIAGKRRRYGDSIITQYIQLRLEKSLLGIHHAKQQEDFLGIIHRKIYQVEELKAVVNNCIQDVLSHCVKIHPKKNMKPETIRENACTIHIRSTNKNPKSKYPRTQVSKIQ